MAAVRIEEEAFSDFRYERLALEAGLADADHARGKMARVWRQCTIENRENLEVFELVSILGTNAVAALEKARLGELDETVLDAEGNPTVRIRGSAGRIEWLQKLRENGKKGGRPRKNQKVSKPKTKRHPSGFENQNPPAPVLAPAPVGDSAREVEHLPSAEERDREYLRRAQAIHQELVEAASLVRSLPDAGPPPTPIPGKRFLADCGLLSAVEGYTDEQLRHAIAVRAAECREKNTARYLNPAMVWGKGLSYAVSAPVPGASPTRGGFKQMAALSEEPCFD